MGSMVELKQKAVLAKDHTKALHDTLLIDADTVDGSHASDFAPSPVTEADITLADIITNDVSITKHGFAPKAPNDTTKFLRGDGGWAVPPSGSIAELELDGNGDIQPTAFASGTFVGNEPYDISPAETIVNDAFFEADVNGDLQPV